MEDEIVMIEPRLSLSSLVSWFLHKFTYGDTPSPNFPGSRFGGGSAWRNMDFDLHPGPAKDAITDAKNLDKMLLVYVYCQENAACAATEPLFHRLEVSSQIAAGFVFYAAPVTTSDGYAMAVGSKFTDLPLLMVVKPTGDTLSTCQIMCSSQGVISEETLVSMLPVARPGRTDADHSDALILQQNDDFQDAELEVQMAEEAEGLREAEEVRRREIMEREFREIPEVDASETEACTVKFHFPDNGEFVKVFNKSSPTSLMFAYARHFVYPNEFVLRTGFPLECIRNNDVIGKVCSGRHAVVHVVFEEV